jgi:hypothetical protein
LRGTKREEAIPTEILAISKAIKACIFNLNTSMSKIIIPVRTAVIRVKSIMLEIN